MNHIELSFYNERKFSPLSYWVHYGVGEDSRPYVDCDEFDPPFPKRDPAKGFPFLLVEINGFEFQFASLYEVRHCIEVLGQKHLPTTIQLSQKRGTSLGPNSHWLSRLPSKIKSWSKREKIVDGLMKVEEKTKNSSIDF